MSYVRDSLLPKEKILFTAKIHFAVFLPAILAVFFAIGFFAYSIYLFNQLDTEFALFASTLFCSSGFFVVLAIGEGIRGLLIFLTTEFAVTNRRVIAKRGFIRRQTVEMLLQKVESVRVNQNVVGRVLDFGTVTVTGTGGTSGSFRGIAKPLVVRKRINQVIEHYSPQSRS